MKRTHYETTGPGLTGAATSRVMWGREIQREGFTDHTARHSTIEPWAGRADKVSQLPATRSEAGQTYPGADGFESSLCEACERWSPSGATAIVSSLASESVRCVCHPRLNSP